MFTCSSHFISTVIDHAGPSFATRHFHTLAPEAAAFAPLCDFVLTAYEMATTSHHQQWQSLGLSTKNVESAGSAENAENTAEEERRESAVLLTDANARAKAREAMKVRVGCEGWLFFAWYTG